MPKTRTIKWHSVVDHQDVAAAVAAVVADLPVDAAVAAVVSVAAAADAVVDGEFGLIPTCYQEIYLA